MIDLPNQRNAPFQSFPEPSNESFNVLEFEGNRPTCSWHFHSECQLSMVLEGEGQRVIGDRIQLIEKGEISLIGSNLPHVWQYDKRPDNKVHVVVVHFREDFAGSDFMNKPEMQLLRHTLKRARQGLQLRGSDREAAQAILSDMPQRNGFARVLGLLEILERFTVSEDCSPICSASFQSVEARIDRLQTVYSFVEAHLDQPIDRSQAANIAHLTPSAFSRFFKQSSGVTFQEFLNDRRIGHACRLLMDPNPSVTEISLRCGFANVTSFNRSFRKLKGTSPTQFRKRFASIARTA